MFNFLEKWFNRKHDMARVEIQVMYRGLIACPEFLDHKEHKVHLTRTEINIAKDWVVTVRPLPLDGKSVIMENDGGVTLATINSNGEVTFVDNSITLEEVSEIFRWVAQAIYSKQTQRRLEAKEMNANIDEVSATKIKELYFSLVAMEAFTEDRTFEFKLDLLDEVAEYVIKLIQARRGITIELKGFPLVCADINDLGLVSTVGALPLSKIEVVLAYVEGTIRQANNLKLLDNVVMGEGGVTITKSQFADMDPTEKYLREHFKSGPLINGVWYLEPSPEVKAIVEKWLVPNQSLPSTVPYIPITEVPKGLGGLYREQLSNEVPPFMVGGYNHELHVAACEELIQLYSSSELDKLSGMARPYTLVNSHMVVNGSALHPFEAQKVKDGFYVPVVDEPSPFGPDVQDMVDNPWIVWRRNHYDKHNSDVKNEVDHVEARKLLKAFLEKEGFRTSVQLVDLPCEYKVGKDIPSLGYLICTRYQIYASTPLSWESLHDEHVTKLVRRRRRGFTDD